MRFIHVTDTHIAASPGSSAAAALAAARLTALVDALNSLTFPVDFVLHTGDVTQDGTEAAYRAAGEILSRLHHPVRYLAGNHDDAALLQRVLLGSARPLERFDYRFEVGGTVVAALDSRGPRDPEGTLMDDQLAGLRELCTPAGPPLLIAIHHPPVSLDTEWLDRGWPTAAGRGASMLLDRRREFMEAIAPARERLHGVFFGHIHRSFQVMHQGILFSSAPSGFELFRTWPNLERPEHSPGEPPGFSVVTVSAEGTTIRQHALPG